MNFTSNCSSPQISILIASNHTANTWTFTLLLLYALASSVATRLLLNFPFEKRVWRFACTLAYVTRLPFTGAISSWGIGVLACSNGLRLCTYERFVTHGPALIPNDPSVA